MLIDEIDEELMDRLESLVHILAGRHPDNLNTLESEILNVIDNALTEHRRD